MIAVAGGENVTGFDASRSNYQYRQDSKSNCKQPPPPTLFKMGLLCRLKHPGILHIQVVGACEPDVWRLPLLVWLDLNLFRQGLRARVRGVALAKSHPRPCRRYLIAKLPLVRSVEPAVSAASSGVPGWLS